MHMISTTGYRGQHTFLADTAVPVTQLCVSWPGTASRILWAVAIAASLLMLLHNCEVLAEKWELTSLQCISKHPTEACICTSKTTMKEF